jgi:signal transduction histidine kinase
MKFLLPKHITLPFYNVDDLRARLGWHINLRWIAIIGVLSSVPISKELFIFNIPYSAIIYITVIMLIVNLVYFFFYRYMPLVSEIREMIYAEIQVITDLIILSFLIHYSGGIDNPFYSLYLVPTILSGIIFPGRLIPFLNATVSALLLSIWTFAEYSGITGSYKLGQEPVSISRLITSISAFYLVNFVGIYIIYNFIQRYRLLKSVIDEKNLQLERSIEDRNKAYRFAAHELKAPLTAIKSTLDVIAGLYGSTLNPDVIDLIGRTERRSTQALDMIKELIVITQYNLGVEQIHTESVEFVSWLKECVDLQSPNAEVKSIRLQFLNPCKHIEVEIDKTGMERVVSNLVSNALRYTNIGGCVTIEPFIKTDGFGFTVKDTGIGIAAEDIKNIFNEFYRTKEARQMEKFGTGLGLNMVNEIVKRNGGTVKVISKPAEGSIFTVTIPFEPDEPALANEEEIRKLFLFE